MADRTPTCRGRQRRRWLALMTVSLASSTLTCPLGLLNPADANDGACTPTESFSEMLREGCPPLPCPPNPCPPSSRAPSSDQRGVMPMPNYYDNAPMPAPAPIPNYYGDGVPQPPPIMTPPGQSAPVPDPGTDLPTPAPQTNDSSGNELGLDAPVTDSAADAAPAPAANNFNNVNASDFSSSFASTQAGFSSAPTFIGDFQGGGLGQIQGQLTQSFQVYAIGDGALLPTFDLYPGGGFDPDFLAIGTGRNESPFDSFDDTFDIAEPVPPTDAPLPNGPGFVFQGGTAVYTDNMTDTTAQDGSYGPGDLWYLDYSYALALGAVSENGRPVPGPGVSVRRVKLSENFSPEVRDRVFTNFSFFNDSFGGLGDISRFVLGVERVVVDQLASVELRLPLAGTYASKQALDQIESRDMELGNFTFLTKIVLLRRENFLWSGGLGIGTPTADDTRISLQGADLLAIQNKSVQIQPFTGLLIRPNADWVFQAYTQLDIAAGGDPVLVNTNLTNPTLGRLEQIGDFTDSTLMHIDLAASRTLYSSNCKRHGLTTVMGNAELLYTRTLQDSDIVTQGGFTYQNLQPSFNILNATFGSHLVFGNGLVVTPAMSVPLREGLDEQFDYEAILQCNYFF